MADTDFHGFIPILIGRDMSENIVFAMFIRKFTNDSVTSTESFDKDIA